MACLSTACTAAWRTLLSVMGSTSVINSIAMSVIGELTPARCGSLRSRSYSSKGTPSVTSDLPLSISATRALGSVTNLIVTLLNAGFGPQYLSKALSLTYEPCTNSSIMYGPEPIGCFSKPAAPTFS